MYKSYYNLFKNVQQIKKRLHITKLLPTSKGLRGSSTTNRAMDTNYFILKILGIYYQSCLGCGLQVCRWSFQQKSSTLRRSKRRGRQTAAVRNFPKQTCRCQKTWLSFRASPESIRRETVPCVCLKTFFKTKTCCVSTPDHMTAVEYSFNTSGCSVGEVFSKNRLHPGIQSAVDGELHGLEPF